MSSIGKFKIGVSAIGVADPTTGTPIDIAGRINRLIPTRWFNYAAPLRDAVIGGLADALGATYSFVSYAAAQTRISTASDFWLDLVANDYFGLVIQRRTGEADDVFAARIKREIFRERVTRKGMISAISDLTGKEPAIFEPWNTFDTGGYGLPPTSSGIGDIALGDSPIGGGGFTPCNLAYGAAGAYGSMTTPAQAYVTVWRINGGGSPNAAGYGDSIGGYGVGSLEYGAVSSATGGVTDAEIITTVNMTRPTGVNVVLSITG